MLISTNKAKWKVCESGKDFRNLGRWAWTRYQGTDNVKLRVISAYRCCDNSGPTTVYSQQRRYFDNLDDDRHPRDIMLQELCEQILNWQNEGDQIILMMDANEHVDFAHIKDVFEAIGLREAIIEKHKEDSGYAPTYQRGQDPIDGIFISDTLHISAGGYLPFGDAPSDHRAQWIQVTCDIAFEYTMDTPKPLAAQRMKMNNPSVVKKFQQSYHSFIRDHKLYNKLYALQTEFYMFGWSDDLAQRYEKIRQSRKAAICHADLKCRKLHMGEVPWSLTLQACRDEITLWHAVMSRKKGTKVSTRFITRLEKRTKTRNSLQYTLQETSKILTETYRRYYALRKDAHNLRDSWLQDLAALKAKEEGGDGQAIYNQLRLQERQRSASRRLKRTMGKTVTGGLTKTSIRLEDGQTKELTDRLEIENAIHEENRAKFSQTHLTPPMTAPLLYDLGITGESIACAEILAGTYIPHPDTDPYAQEYLKELAMPKHIRNKPLPILETENYVSGWKKMKEKTSAGISGIHFGHMKACALDPDLAAFEASLSHLPYASGYSPEEWQTAINHMLEKKAKET